MNDRRGFTLIELLVVVTIIALLVGILLPALTAARKAARAAVCSTNLTNYSKAIFAYGADHRDRFATYSWQRGKVYTLYNQSAPVGPFASDVLAAGNQFTDLMRRFGPIPDFSYTASIAYPNYAAAVVAEYLSQKIPDPVMVCPEDKVQLRYSADPIATSQELAATDPVRWSRSSYVVSTPFWGVDRDSVTDRIRSYRTGMAAPGYTWTATTATGRRKLSEVAFPSQKVMYFDEYSRHTRLREVHYSHPESLVPCAIADGSVRTLKASETNPGGAITLAGTVERINATYAGGAQFGLPDWPSSASPTQPVRFLQTLSGLKGIDFGGSEIIP